MQITIDELIRQFGTYESVINDLLKDLKDSKKATIYYNIDFSLLFEYLWGSSPASIPPFKPYGRITDNLVQALKHKPQFQLVFTGPSFWELLDSIVHEADRMSSYEFGAKTQHKDIQGVMKGMNDFSDFQKVLIDSGVASRQLPIPPMSPTYSGHDARLRKRVSAGLGDCTVSGRHPSRLISFYALILRPA